MLLNIETDLTESKWYTYMDGIKFKIRTVTPELSKKFRTENMNNIEAGGTILDNLNEEGFDSDFYCHAITDWLGIVDSTSKTVPCNKGNIEHVIKNYGEIKTFIYNCSKKSANELSFVKEELVKN